MSHYRFFSARIGLCALLLLALAPMAQASVFINYSVAGAAGPFTNETDTASLSSFASTATLVDGVSQLLQIGVLNFTEVDNSAWTPSVLTFNVDRALSINSNNGTLLQNLTMSISAITDTASVDGLNTIMINLGGGQFVDVTTLGFSRNAAGNATYNDPIYANFLLQTTNVPEPGSLSLLAIGALGMFAASRRRKQDKA